MHFSWELMLMWIVGKTAGEDCPLFRCIILSKQFLLLVVTFPLFILSIFNTVSVCNS